MAEFQRFASDEASLFFNFIQYCLMPNKPCIIDEKFTRDWKSRKYWQCNGKPNFCYLQLEFGHAEVPVADCNTEQFSTHSKTMWKLNDYLTYWKDNCTSIDSHLSTEIAGPKSGKKFYLKDWHFARDFPDYNAYTVLDVFKMDWINEAWDLLDSERDDYRFVYMGPKGTWTPFHADVFRSYSWSVNVCGCKEWLLYPPGEEEHLRDIYGNLPFDVSSPELQDTSKFPNVHKVKGPIRVIQNIGEAIFVPSGWFHQVRNLEDTISINHNWTNGFGIHYMWNHLKSEFKLVEREISDCKDMEGWSEQCQLILKCNTGMNFTEFVAFLSTIAHPRITQLRQILESEDTRIDDVTETSDTLLLIIKNELARINPTLQTRTPTAASPVQYNSYPVPTTLELLETLLIEYIPVDIRSIIVDSHKWREEWSLCVKMTVVIRTCEVSRLYTLMEESCTTGISHNQSLIEIFCKL